MEPFFVGIATGAAMSLMLGTVFFALIQNSVKFGPVSGLFIASGVVASDVLLIALGYFNANLMPSGGAAERWVRISGGAFLLLYGINSLRKKRRIVSREFDRASPRFLAASGFLLNILNPANFILWLAVVANYRETLGYTDAQTLMALSGALSAIFGMEAAIALSASRLKSLFTDALLRKFDIAVGVLFVGFAIWIISPAVTSL
ncbi:MAG: LysE family translocator [Saprospiraceae bacterium]